MGSWSFDEGDINGFKICQDFNWGLEWEWESNNLKWFNSNSDCVPITLGLQRVVEKKRQTGNKGEKMCYP